MHRAVALVKLAREHLPGVTDLLGRQQARWHALDPRLRQPLSAEETTRELEEMALDPALYALVALDSTRGEALGCAIAEVRELPPDSESLTFMGPRDGAVRLLALPGPDDPRNLSVTKALFDGIEAWWATEAATGANMLRPVCDGWLWPLLERRGWLWVSVSALRPAGPLPPSSRMPLEGLTARLAQPDDEEAVVSLHVEEYTYHMAYDPTVRVVPAVEREMREILADIWAAQKESDGPIEADPGRQVFVIDCRGEPVAMSIAYSYMVSEDSPRGSRGRGLLALGHYCHIGSTGVRADMRGKGVGRALIESITRFYDPTGVQAYTLTYHLRNPLSSAFWPNLGWVPLVARYVKRKA